MTPRKPEMAGTYSPRTNQSLINNWPTPGKRKADLKNSLSALLCNCEQMWICAKTSHMAVEENSCGRRAPGLLFWGVTMPFRQPQQLCGPISFTVISNTGFTKSTLSATLHAMASYGTALGHGARTRLFMSRLQTNHGTIFTLAGGLTSNETGSARNQLRQTRSTVGGVGAQRISRSWTTTPLVREAKLQHNSGTNGVVTLCQRPPNIVAGGPTRWGGAIAWYPAHETHFLGGIINRPTGILERSIDRFRPQRREAANSHNTLQCFVTRRTGNGLRAQSTRATGTAAISRFLIWRDIQIPGLPANFTGHITKFCCDATRNLNTPWGQFCGVPEAIVPLLRDSILPARWFMTPLTQGLTVDRCSERGLVGGSLKHTSTVECARVWSAGRIYGRFWPVL